MVRGWQIFQSGFLTARRPRRHTGYSARNVCSDVLHIAAGIVRLAATVAGDKSAGAYPAACRLDRPSRRREQPDAANRRRAVTGRVGCADLI